ncbi:MAG: tRNA uridine-5-carboxymethylaminomethyl(34) synthesis GTPase MnmE [Verrucomicrobiales bacterium]
MNELDSIAAISTPLGESGLAVVRVSGAQALAIGDVVFQPKGKLFTKPSAAKSHTVHYGHALLNGKVVDEVMLTVFRAPRTFTREEMIEISCHGGILPAKMVLDALLHAGARLAEPGEFTKRAFLNGRIDLAQAEAVADLIHARTELALSAANEQLAGKLSRKIDKMRETMISILAHVEAHIDFPDEDIAPDTKDQLVARLRDASEQMDALLRTANEGQILRRGIRVAIIGKPNAGKSSLLNHLLGHERAIVSPIPGTTRDTIEETANIRGIPIHFIDTAGLREANDLIEQEGIRRSRATIARAELILHVIDHTDGSTDELQTSLIELADKKQIVVINKIDLPGNPPQLPAGIVSVPISCETGSGMEALKDAIKNIVWSGEIKTEMLGVMINSRHQEALNRARKQTDLTITALMEGHTLELAAMDLRLAVNAIGEIVGKTSTEDLLDSIFGQFCLGK